MAFRIHVTCDVISRPYIISVNKVDFSLQRIEYVEFVIIVGIDTLGMYLRLKKGQFSMLI